jgi:hypothetical protein
MLAFALVGRSKPDFSGLWRLNLEKSTFTRGPAPKEIVVNIEHHEPTLIESMLVVAVDGSEQRQNVTYDTRGEQSNVAVSGGEGLSRARWNGRELVIDSTFRTASRTFHFSDHWSLSRDAHTLTMAHPDDDLAGQVAVFERAPTNVAGRFNTA